MPHTKIVDPTRIRQTHNGFGFIPHRFLKDGFLSSLDPTEAHLYLFYSLAANRYGISFYSDRRMCDLLNLSCKHLRIARDGLIHKDLICCEEQLCQLLELPLQPVSLSEQADTVGPFEERLLLSILKKGIREPLRGVCIEGVPCLLDGFKRLRCAKRLAIDTVPYQSLGNDEAMGIIELMRESLTQGLNVIEQIKLIDTLK
jgi:hypothetical protein